MGAASENRVLDLLQKAALSLPWVKHIRKANRAEDLRGRDIIVTTTDTEDIYIQVKSSHGAAVSEYIAKHGHRPEFQRTLIIIAGAGASLDSCQRRLEDMHRSLLRRAQKANQKDAHARASAARDQRMEAHAMNHPHARALMDAAKLPPLAALAFAHEHVEAAREGTETIPDKKARKAAVLHNLVKLALAAHPPKG